MTYLSIIDKLLILFNLLKESIFIIIFLSVILIAIILRIIKKISKSKLLSISIISMILLFTTIVIKNYKILSLTFDNFLDIIFTNIYFPSIYIYLFVIASSYVVLITTIFNQKQTNTVKTINYLMVFLLNLLLNINLIIISKDKIDIFSISSLYTSINLVSMLELSMSIYIIWLIIRSCIYLINNITNLIIVRKENKKLIINEVNMEVLEPINNEGTNIEIKEDKQDLFIEGTEVLLTENNLSETINIEYLEEISNTTPKFIDTNLLNVIETDINNENKLSLNQLNKLSKEKTYEYLDVEPEEIEKEFINKEQSEDILTNILNNTLVPEVPKEEYSLNDYKTFSKMLKETIQLNNSKNLNLSDMLSFNLLNKFTIEEYSLFEKMIKNYTR